MGVASDLYWVVCRDGGVLGGVAEVGEEEGVKWMRVGIGTGCWEGDGAEFGSLGVMVFAVIWGGES